MFHKYWFIRSGIPKSVQLIFSSLALLLLVLGVSGDECPRPKVADLRKIAERDGYTLETHSLKTSDAYNLTLFFLPQTKVPVQSARTVFLQHGIFSSADFWFLNSVKKENLAYALHDQGYNVMLGNFRGTTHSMEHRWLEPSSSGFWDFSWHEFGTIDLPYMIDYTLKLTKQFNLTLIGDSMGSTSSFVMLSDKPEYNKKVAKFVAIAPVAFMGNVRNPAITMGSRLLTLKLDWAISFLGLNRFSFGELPFVSQFLDTCARIRATEQQNQTDGLVASSVSGQICAFFLHMHDGVTGRMTKSTVERFLMDFPLESASFKTLIHYAQIVNSGQFGHFDAGWAKNLWNYRSRSPPDYDLSQVSVPVMLVSSPGDSISSSEDVEKLKGELKSVKELTHVTMSDVNWGHTDLTMAQDCHKYVYEPILEFLRK